MDGEMTKPIMPTLREMEVGDVQVWPIERYDVVRVSMNRANLMMRPEGRKFSLSTKDLTVEVVRIA